jgi:CheY-like chemotaxis protein
MLQLRIQQGWYCLHGAHLRVFLKTSGRSSQRTIADSFGLATSNATRVRDWCALLLDSEREMPTEALLNSWKEIAVYMGRSERTVQRWEKHFGLPVRRPAGRARSAVIALPSEIQAWFRTAPANGQDFNSGISITTQPSLAVSAARPTLLCIDRHPEGLAVRKALLEAVGYTVLTASNGRSGLRLFTRKRVDLVVLDHSMPDLNGETVAHMLHERNPRIPILLLSGTIKNIPGRLLKIVDNFVQKGQPVDVLLSSISELCRKDSSAFEKETPEPGVSYIRNHAA